MKLSHLSLAIFSAIALAACGGSGSGSAVTDQKPGGDMTPGGTDQTPGDKDKDEKEEVPQEDQEVVNPTGEEVVDNITLSKESTYASQQYIRSAKSNHDQRANPGNGNPSASTTVLSGVTLDIQNPFLTNIVVARAEGSNKDGGLVKIAQYAGSDDKYMESQTALRAGSESSLQKINEPNALVATVDNVTGYVTYDNFYYVLDNNPVFAITNNLAAAKSDYDAKLKTYNEELGKLEAALKDADATNWDAKSASVQLLATNFANASDNLNNAAVHLRTEVNSHATKLKDFGISPNKVKVAVANAPVVAALKNGGNFGVGTWNNAKNAFIDKIKDGSYKLEVTDVTTSFGGKLRNYGYGLYPVFTYHGSTVTTPNDRGFGDRIVAADKKVVGVVADSTSDAGAPTHGLVAIGTDSYIRGLEDNNVRTSRVFGHYYRDPGSPDGSKLNEEADNSWLGAAVYVTGVDTANKPNDWRLGAIPQKLDHVQYGRVTVKIDALPLEDENATNGWQYRHQDVENRDPAKEFDADDFYFYRGTGATSVDEMAKLPTNTKINYAGHALMYGIDNSFHGAGDNLPNAFSRQQGYGLGNFVNATLDMGEQKFDGTVYNVWHNVDKKDIAKDDLVKFTGKIKGNTVIGSAERVYLKEETNPAIFRASFYGNRAQEVGGAFNAVTDKEVYSKDIKDNWGGVFGAHRTSSGGTAWLVSSEKK